MNDIHIRAILLLVLAALSMGGAAGLKLAGFQNAPALFVLAGLVSIGVAIFLLLYADAEEAR